VVGGHAEAEGHQFDDGLGVGGELERLLHARVVAGRAVGAQPHQVEAVGRHRHGLDPALALQGEEQRRRHAHDEVDLAAAQRVDARHLVAEEDELERRDAGAPGREVVGVGAEAHAVADRVAHHHERAGAVEAVSASSVPARSTTAWLSLRS
jgi:hypothetical protein